MSDLGYVRLTAIGDQSEAGAGKKPWLKVSDGKIQAHAEPEGLTATLSSDSTQLVYDSAALTSTTVDVSASKTGTIVVTMGYQTDNAGQVTETTQQTFKLIIKAATPTSFDRATVSDMTAVDFVDTELDQKPSLVGDLLYAEALPAGSTGNVTPSQGGSFTIRQWTSNGLAVETLKSKSVQVAVSGPGALWDGVSAKDYISFMNWQAGTFPQGGQTVYILNDGRAGTATITVVRTNGSSGSMSATFSTIAGGTAVSGFDNGRVLAVDGDVGNPQVGIGRGLAVIDGIELRRRVVGRSGALIAAFGAIGCRRRHQGETGLGQGHSQGREGNIRETRPFIGRPIAERPIVGGKPLEIGDGLRRHGRGVRARAWR